jgi:cobalt-zinc-cadmium efflux system protein
MSARAHASNDGHEAGQGHAHAQGRGASTRRLTIVLALSSTYMLAEAIGGYLANSLALLADAGHMLSDVAALALAVFAMRIARKPATPKRSFGYYRTEILAALANGATLVAISLLIFVEAYDRFRAPPAVAGREMMGIAAGGLAINLIGLWILSAGRGESQNERGAWLHVLTDALGSVGAIAGGALVTFLGWRWADPAVSVLIALLGIYSSWELLRESVAVLMESAPGHIDVDAVRDAIAATAGVVSVHDLHIWSITSGMVSLSAHICTGDLVPPRDLLQRLGTMLRERFNIVHVTLQLEPEGYEEVETHA